MAEKIEMKKIWMDEETGNDSYAVFVGNFTADTYGKITVRIACDSMYALKINGELKGFGQCSDYPHHKYFDEITVAPDRRENAFEITVWFTGYECLTYILGEPMLAFRIEQNGKTLCESGKDILSRRDVKYKNGYCKAITTQMGYGFYYDNRVENTLPFKKSRELGTVTAYARGIDNLVLEERAPAVTERTEYGYFIDLGCETVGFLDLEFVSPCEQEILVAYGEHAENKQVSRIIAYRDFSVTYCATQGENAYMNPFRRLACRYLQVFAKYPLDIKYLGIRPVTRAQKEIARRINDPLARKIYDVSVNTLKACMHEHYEDCPWREQALYNMDSRNQMLCGYFAFENADFQKFNLTLMTYGLWNEHGVLSMCFPSRFDKYIPFFSLVYVLQIYEYVRYTGDKSILKDTEATVRRIIKNFGARVDESGLIADFPPPLWNFYEWTKSNYGVNDAVTGEKKIYDLILNCMYVYVCGLYDGLLGEHTPTDSVKTAIRRVFFNEEKGIYKACTEGESYSQLGNSLAVLCGLGGEEILEKIISDDTVEKISLSMNTFFYDALLKIGGKYKDFILDDIKNKYKPMLDAGATTFWETELGYKDFGGAGSLCHGWSAIPVYYYSVLGVAEKYEKTV